MPDEVSVQTQGSAPVAAQECDVLVVGGGPGGSTAAAVLAERGRDVVVLEKAQHPRFHIGESLLPANLPLFDRLGIADEIKRIGLYKPGAEFVSDYYKKSNLFLFATATHLIASHAYQVRRATFDQVLFQNAQRRGARTFENTRVLDVAFEGNQRPVVTAVGPDGTTTTWRPRFVVDASGRDTLMATKFGLKQSNKRNNTAAIYGHFKGVPRRPGDTEGIISVHLVEGGWFWMIPLPDGLMSVGMVGSPSLFKSRTASIDELFWNTVKSSPSVSERMKTAELTQPLTTTGNYSYSTRPTGGERYALIGDAFTFIDPIFSSGVMIAMTSGIIGAEAIDAFLADETRGLGELRSYERRVRSATDNLSWLIYRINDPVMRQMLMHPTNKFRIRDSVISMLAGEIFDQKWTTRIPLMLFKVAYYTLSLKRRLTRSADGAFEPQVSESPSRS